MEEFRAFVRSLPRSGKSDCSIIDDGSRDGICQFTLSDNTFTFDIVACEARAALAADDCLVAFFAKHITGISCENKDDPQGEVCTDFSTPFTSLRARDPGLCRAVMDKFQSVDDGGEPFWNRVMDEIDFDMKLVHA